MKETQTDFEVVALNITNFFSGIVAFWINLKGILVLGSHLSVSDMTMGVMIVCSSILAVMMLITLVLFPDSPID